MKSDPTPAPGSQSYGSWVTPLTSQRLVEAASKFGELAVAADGALWWSESRPSEGGRVVLVRRSPDGGRAEVMVSAEVNVRSRVHEYGGGAWWLSSDEAWFANFSDQRLYRLASGADPVAVTAEPAVPAGDRFADGRPGPDPNSATCVRERHSGDGRVDNEIVTVGADGTIEVVVSGPDFVSDPRWWGHGSLCWLQWNHPNMPWDGTELVVRSADGREQVVAGGVEESVCQPIWAVDGSLCFLSDRSGWWNLYRWSAAGGSDGTVEPILAMDAEIGGPQWVFGQSRYALLDDGRVMAAACRDALDRLYVVEADGTVRHIDLPYSAYRQLRAVPGGVVCLAGSPTAELSIVRIAADDGAVEVVAAARELGLDEGWFSVPEAVSFPSGSSGRTAHALVYPPRNPHVSAPEGELPPLIVMIHGGPTSMAEPLLNLSVQYWTTRGFTVADVNYGGSTGYGRPYRDLLRGNWGVVDVEDCVACAKFLANAGRVDPERMAITGSSAGGYTALAVLTVAPGVFSAGASHYGIADLTRLAADTHKFESRYNDRLLGPLPEAQAIYDERSPITHAKSLRTPLAVFQGLEDEVVPPEQARLIVAALAANGVDHAEVFFEGEQHGFRMADNIRAALDGELSFYAQIFGFDLPAEEGISPIEIHRAPQRI